MLDEAREKVIRIALHSEPMAVRRALKGLFSTRSLRRLHVDQRGTAEIVLAEVLNNVVEHAYADRSGRIEVSVGLHESSLLFTIIDYGVAMPGGTLPQGKLCELAPGTDLPEGGFGWHMIRALAKEIAYRRLGNRNELSFRLDLG
jgi:serine/threonine-protein kinase RsbW